MDRNAREKALEAYLVAAARTGDRAAQARLVRLRGPRLLSHAARLLGEAEGARDVTQDAWVEILRGLGRLRNDAAFLPWALRIVTRRVARVIRARQRDRKLAAAFTAEAPRHLPDPSGATAAAAELYRAIASLPPDQAAAIALYYLEDLGVAEVALALDVPQGTIKTRLMHARRKLRIILEGDNNDRQT